MGVPLRCAPGRAARAVGNDTTVANGAEPPPQPGTILLCPAAPGSRPCGRASLTRSDPHESRPAPIATGTLRHLQRLQRHLGANHAHLARDFIRKRLMSSSDFLRKRCTEPAVAQTLARDRRISPGVLRAEIQAWKPASQVCQRGPPVGAEVQCTSKSWSGACFRKSAPMRIRDIPQGRVPGRPAPGTAPPSSDPMNDVPDPTDRRYADAETALILKRAAEAGEERFSRRFVVTQWLPGLYRARGDGCGRVARGLGGTGPRARVGSGSHQHDGSSLRRHP